MVIEDVLYPPIEPIDRGSLDVGNGHEIYWEQSGNPHGKPVVVLHGGPGGGSQPEYRSFFDPARFNIIQFDQRGCGASTPHASLEHNTTGDLIADIETIRKFFGFERWLVFGGSWGSTLALAYAIHHPDRVSSLILRGIFMCRRKELRWFYQHGASEMYPDVFEAYRDHIPEEEREDLMGAYHKRLTSEDAEVRLAAARRWSAWEMATSRLLPDEDYVAKADDDEFALAFARIESHYFVNNIFLEEDFIMKNVHKIEHIPGVIVQGRYDVVCPPVSAWELHKAWPQSKLEMIPDAGHSIVELGIAQALVRATNAYANTSL
jgi:proline iminopeptidase